MGARPQTKSTRITVVVTPHPSPSIVSRTVHTLSLSAQLFSIQASTLRFSRRGRGADRAGVENELPEVVHGQRILSLESQHRQLIPGELSVLIILILTTVANKV